MLGSWVRVPAGSRKAITKVVAFCIDIEIVALTINGLFLFLGDEKYVKTMSKDANFRSWTAYFCNQCMIACITVCITKIFNYELPRIESYQKTFHWNGIKYSIKISQKELYSPQRLLFRVQPCIHPVFPPE